MNYKYWRQNHGDRIFLAKLMEELGGVSRAALNRDSALSASNPRKRGVKSRTAELAEELEHVEFLARTWRRYLDQEWSQM